jgi:hypothetical protein
MSLFARTRRRVIQPTAGVETIRSTRRFNELCNCASARSALSRG